MLFTSAYGPRTPVVAGAAEVGARRRSRPTAPNTDLAGTVTATASGGGEPIPPAGAVLMAAGACGGEAAGGSAARDDGPRAARPAAGWDGVTAALGGGPLLVRNGKAVFRSLEDFTNDQVGCARPRARAVGQLADGRIVLVAVDGGRPGLQRRAHELRARAGARPARRGHRGRRRSRRRVTAAFDGRLLNRPSGRSRARRQGGAARPVLRRLRAASRRCRCSPASPGCRRAALVQGRAALDRDRHARRPGRRRRTRSSRRAARRRAPTASPLPRSTKKERGAGTSRPPTTSGGLDGRAHVPVRHDAARPRRSADRARAADGPIHARARGEVQLPIQTPGGVIVRALAPVQPPAGRQSIVWDGRLPGGSRALRRRVRCARRRHERRRHVRARRRLRVPTVESRGDLVARPLRHLRHLRADGDRRGLPGGERARDALRRRACLRRARARARRRRRHTTGFAAYIAVVARRSLGYQFGSNRRLVDRPLGGRPFVERHGRWLHLSTAQLDRAERWFERWDVWAVFLGRVTPVARSFVSIPAGVFESPLARYNVLTLARERGLVLRPRRSRLGARVAAGTASTTAFGTPRSPS